ncbi:hypothetical protein PU634_11215 [Oceanimonas pelagia]|uniref:Lipoprotein n=1 Tax=Oceanimonas pelagia TaxID=3028314 RepID=A0AA50Q6R6_9GAMM|nr:hypothetical protein [Oceanimonas pelagia]WMC09685.1 hypothetical protein PU634_11215 [Oceanimonas pelagia]
MRGRAILLLLFLTACTSQNNNERVDFSMVDGSWIAHPMLCTTFYPQNSQECTEVSIQRHYEEKTKNTAQAKMLRGKLNITNPDLEVFILNGVNVNDKGELVPYGEFSLFKIMQRGEGKDDILLYGLATYPYYLAVFKEDANINLKEITYNNKLYEVIRCGVMSDAIKNSLNKPSFLIVPISCY